MTLIFFLSIRNNIKIWCTLLNNPLRALFSVHQIFYVISSKTEKIFQSFLKCIQNMFRKKYAEKAIMYRKDEFGKRNCFHDVEC